MYPLNCHAKSDMEKIRESDFEEFYESFLNQRYTNVTQNFKFIILKPGI